MIPLAIGVAILDAHTRLAHLETNAPHLAAIGTAVDRRIGNSPAKKHLEESYANQ
jgi:hypothetical protein